MVRLKDVYVSGISFDLDGLHPTLLFVIFLGCPHIEVLEARRNDPGSEYIEGALRFVPATMEDRDTREVLSKKEWIPSGQASFIRALEIVSVIHDNYQPSR